MALPITILSSKILESSAFRSRYANMQIHNGKVRLGFQRNHLNNNEINRLILQASVLALSENISHRTVAQKINALLLETSADNSLISYAIQVVLSRLGNFPAISNESNIFQENHLFRQLSSDSNSELIHSLGVEVLGNLYSEEQDARLQLRNKVLHFNVFQKEIFDALNNTPLVSFSAPTSFGKSFIVRHHIARRFINNDVNSVLIIVPTKSLIDDFFESILGLKMDLGLNIGIYSHARSLENVERNNIFILTQERLSFLIEQAPEFVRNFQIVYCDEAHYISRGYRGFVLRSVLRKVTELCGVDGVNGNTQYIFSSPLIKNPEYYRDVLFPNLPIDKSFHKEVLFSPVEKNVHFVLKGRTNSTYSLLRDNYGNKAFEENLDEIGSLDFPTELHGERYPSEIENEKYDDTFEITKDIYIVLNSRVEQRTILYATSPLKAHKYAKILADQLPRQSLIPDLDLRDLRIYIRDHYDESFGLLELIKKGVGLHYGRMPIGLRRIVVRLFEEGYINYIVCTSTLLEGVNLPAKNIFLFSNKQSKQKHTTLSFWNLLGRAGRATYGLSGNIFCIEKNIENYKEFFDNPEVKVSDPEMDVSENDNKRSKVYTSFTNAEKTFEYTKATSRDDIEYLIYELLLSDYPETIISRLRLQKSRMLVLGNAVVDVKRNLQIPLTLLKSNPGIDPRMQDSFFKKLAEFNLRDLTSLIQTVSNPFSLNAEQLSSILNLVQSDFKWPVVNRDFDTVAQLANRLTQWLHEKSISEFVQQSLRHFDNPSVFDRIERALNVIEALDTDLSFKAPKYLKCFFDIIIYQATQKGLQNPQRYRDSIEAFLFAVESGISSPIGRLLFEKGVSRPLAIKVNGLLRGILPTPISIRSFRQQNIREFLEAELSRRAFTELMDHLQG